ncbi:MAG: hypothetical protein FJ304_09610 [Planctomycetes bacterium]|nr:hypothetical protein [Planctomycetota bacterium]
MRGPDHSHTGRQRRGTHRRARGVGGKPMVAHGRRHQWVPDGEPVVLRHRRFGRLLPAHVRVVHGRVRHHRSVPEHHRRQHPEPTETRVLTITGGSGYTIGSPASATIHILDNDAQFVSVSKVGDVTESGANGTLRFTRICDLSAGVTANFSVSGATSGTDFTSIGTTVTFAAGEADQVVDVDALTDAGYDPDETVFATIQTGTGYTRDTVYAATLSIEDAVASVTVVKIEDAWEDGRTGRYIFTRTGDLTDALEVEYTIGGTADAGDDYKALTGTIEFAAGEATAELVMTPESDEDADRRVRQVVGRLARTPRPRPRRVRGALGESGHRNQGAGVPPGRRAAADRRRGRRESVGREARAAPAVGARETRTGRPRIGRPVGVCGYWTRTHVVAGGASGAGAGATGAGAVGATGAFARTCTFFSPAFSSSITAVAPASPSRRSWRLSTRVYPPGRSAKRGPSSRNSFLSTVSALFFCDVFFGSSTSSSFLFQMPVPWVGPSSAIASRR